MVTECKPTHPVINMTAAGKMVNGMDMANSLGHHKVGRIKVDLWQGRSTVTLLFAEETLMGEIMKEASDKVNDTVTEVLLLRSELWKEDSSMTSRTGGKKSEHQCGMTTLGPIAKGKCGVWEE